MAWKARVDAYGPKDLDTIVASVAYYDDAILDKDGLPVVQFTDLIPITSTTNKASLLQAVRDSYARGRRTYDLESALLAQWPVGTTMNLP